VVCAAGVGWFDRSSSALTDLAERLNAPVLTSGTSKGALADDHSLCLGCNWNVGGYAEAMLATADIVLAIGPRAGMATGDRPASHLARQLIHLDWDGAEQGPTVPALLQLAGNVPSLLEAIGSRLRQRSTSGWSPADLSTVRGASREKAREAIPWAL